jgi:hypothetical protein
LHALEPGNEIQFGDLTVQKNSKGQLIFKTPEMRNWAHIADRDGTINKLVSDKFGTTRKVDEVVPGEFKIIPPAGKTRKQLLDELSNIRKKLNQIVPKKSELEKIVAAMPKIVDTGRGRGVGTDKFTLEKYKAAERRINLLSSKEKGTMQQFEKLMGDIPYSSIQEFYTSYLRNINNNLTEPAIKAGKFSNAENITIDTMRKLNRGIVDKQINVFRNSVNKDIQKINTLKKESDKIFAAYELLQRVAPIAENPDKAVAAAVGDAMLLNTLALSEINPAKDFEGGQNSIPRYRVDFNGMVEEALRTKKIKLADKGIALFNDLTKRINQDIPQAGLKKKIFGIFGRGQTPKNINETIKNNLIKDPSLVKFAPRSKVEFDNPRDFQKSWLNLFEKTYGRKATMADVNQASEQARVMGLPKQFMEP